MSQERVEMRMHPDMLRAANSLARQRDVTVGQLMRDLQVRLRSKGYVLPAAGGGLALHDWLADRRICKASELGVSDARLMRRFGMSFLGHAHTWLEKHHLHQTQTGAHIGTPDDSLTEPF